MASTQTLIDRALVGRSLYQLHKLTGASISNLSEMQSGTRPMPPRVAAQLADAVGDDPREAALAAMLAQEKKPEVKERLAKLLKLPTAATVAAAALLAGPPPAQATHATQATQTIGQGLYIMSTKASRRN